MRTQTRLAAAVAALLLTAGMGLSADPSTQPAKGTAHITGHINGPDGKSASGVKIKLVSKATTKVDDTPAKKKKKTVPAPSTTTDADGNFKIDDVVAGQYTVNASLPNVGKAVSQINVLDGQTIDVKMQLVKTSTKTL